MWIVVISFILLVIFLCVNSTPVNSNQNAQIDHVILLKLERVMKVSLALNCCGINGGTIKVEAQNQRICFTTQGTNPVFDILQDLGRIDEFYIEQYVPGCPKSLFTAFKSYLDDKTFVNDSVFGCGEDFYTALFCIPVPTHIAPQYINKLVQLLNSEYPDLRYSHSDSKNLSVVVTPKDRDKASYR